MDKVKKWFENVWYHYKFHIICVMFFLAFLVIVTVQMNTRENIDINIMYAGSDYIGSDLAGMRNAFIQTMSYDYNGDGEKGVQITDITLMTDKQITERVKAADEIGEKFLYNPNDNQDAKKKFELEIFSGEAIICLLDPYWFEYVCDASGLLPLEEALGYKPSGIINEYGVYLKDTEFGKFYTIFENLADDTVLCIRRMTTTTIFKNNKDEDIRYNNHKEMLKDIFEFSIIKEDTSE